MNQKKKKSGNKKKPASRPLFLAIGTLVAALLAMIYISQRIAIVKEESSNNLAAVLSSIKIPTQVTITVTPATPKTVTKAAVATTTKIVWKDNVTNESSYRIIRSGASDRNLARNTTLYSEPYVKDRVYSIVAVIGSNTSDPIKARVKTPPVGGTADTAVRTVQPATLLEEGVSRTEYFAGPRTAHPSTIEACKATAISGTYEGANQELNGMTYKQIVENVVSELQDVSIPANTQGIYRWERVLAQVRRRSVSDQVPSVILYGDVMGSRIIKNKWGKEIQKGGYFFGQPDGVIQYFDDTGTLKSIYSYTLFRRGTTGSYSYISAPLGTQHEYYPKVVDHPNHLQYPVSSPCVHRVLHPNLWGKLASTYTLAWADGFQYPQDLENLAYDEVIDSLKTTSFSEFKPSVYGVSDEYGRPANLAPYYIN